MKGLGAATTALAAISWFAVSVVAQLDPIVIKVRLRGIISRLESQLRAFCISQGSKFFYKTNGTEL